MACGESLTVCMAGFLLFVLFWLSVWHVLFCFVDSILLSQCQMWIGKIPKIISQTLSVFSSFFSSSPVALAAGEISTSISPCVLSSFWNKGSNSNVTSGFLPERSWLRGSLYLSLSLSQPQVSCNLFSSTFAILLLLLPFFLFLLLLLSRRRGPLYLAGWRWEINS